MKFVCFVSVLAVCIDCNTAIAVPKPEYVPEIVGYSGTSGGSYGLDAGSRQTRQNGNKVQANVESPKYITCAYTREVKTGGKIAHTIAGDKGLHYQLMVFNKDTGEPIAGYGKTTWTTTPLKGPGTMLMEKPSTKEGYNPIPKWCIESEGISVLRPEGYTIGTKDCREYAERVREDLMKNHGGREIVPPRFAFLEVKIEQEIATSIDTSKLETQVKKLLSLAQLLVDGGRKISQDQISEHNSYIKGFWEECVVICKKIDALPVPRNEKQRIVKQVGDRVVSTLRPQLEHLDGLMKTAVARGLLEGVELKQLSLTDIQGFIH